MTRTAIAWKHCIFMPEAGKVTLKAQIAEEVAHIRKVRPDLQLVAVADAAADNWTFLERLQPDERAFLPCMRTSQRRRRPSQPIGTTSTVPSCATMPTVSTRSAIRHLRDKATTATALKDLERELRFFQKHRRRMRYAALNAMGYTIGSGVVEAANKVLVNQRMKRARWSMRSERPHLQGIDKVRPIRHGKQWSEQASRTTIRRPSQPDNGKLDFGNMRFTPCGVILAISGMEDERVPGEGPMSSWRLPCFHSPVQSLPSRGTRRHAFAFRAGKLRGAVSPAAPPRHKAGSCTCEPCRCHILRQMHSPPESRQNPP